MMMLILFLAPRNSNRESNIIIIEVVQRFNITSFGRKYLAYVDFEILIKSKPFMRSEQLQYHHIFRISSDSEYIINSKVSMTI